MIPSNRARYAPLRHHRNVPPQRPPCPFGRRVTFEFPPQFPLNILIKEVAK